MSKRIIIILILIIGIVFSTTLIFNYIIYKRVVISNEKSNNLFLSNDTFSFMVETGVDSYEYYPSSNNSWPGKGYEFNDRLSGCENGGTLNWNEETKKITLKNNISDKCYLFFDLVPPDVTLEITNIAYGATSAILNCNNAIANYNQKYQRVEISKINNIYTNCYLTYQQPNAKDYLNQKIINMVETSQGNGQIINQNGYRYSGKDPNNYIWFNNELWRIIGVFDESSHGKTNENLVKIIRTNSIGGLVWHKNSNDWENSYLIKLLNQKYYNSQNATGENCYKFSSTISGNCDFTQIGINDVYRPMIEKVTWYLGGTNVINESADEFYRDERGTNVYTDRPTTTLGYIGLMYVSDYKYASATTGWLYGQGYEWTITPNSSESNGVFYIYYSGLSSDKTRNGYAVRPVLYLNENVFVIDGNGSLERPYIIGM